MPNIHKVPDLVAVSQERSLARTIMRRLRFYDDVPLQRVDNRVAVFNEEDFEVNRFGDDVLMQRVDNTVSSRAETPLRSTGLMTVLRFFLSTTLLPLKTLVRSTIATSKMALRPFAPLSQRMQAMGNSFACVR